jgi:hypothetical protein
MAKRSLLETSLTDEARRTVLREALERYNHELCGDEERQLLRDRILRLRRRLGLVGSCRRRKWPTTT